MIRIVHTSAPPKDGQYKLEKGIGERKPDGTFPHGIMSEYSHGHNAKHLQEGKYPCPDIVVAMEVMIDRPVDPCPPDDDEQEGERAYTLPAHMRREGMRELGDDDDIDEVVEELQERDLAVLGFFTCAPWDLPPEAIVVDDESHGSPSSNTLIQMREH